MAYAYLTPYRRGGGSLFDLHKQMNRMFDDLLAPEDQGGKGKDGKGKGGGATSWPSLEIAQDDNAIHISAELAGVSRDDIEIAMDDGMLVIAGEKNRVSKNDDGYTERTYGRFERHVSVPANLDLEAAEADFEDGVLTVTLPKVEEKSTARKITLNGASERSDDQNRQARIGRDGEKDGQKKDDDKKNREASSKDAKKSDKKKD